MHDIVTIRLGSVGICIASPKSLHRPPDIPAAHPALSFGPERPRRPAPRTLPIPLPCMYFEKTQAATSDTTASRWFGFSSGRRHCPQLSRPCRSSLQRSSRRRPAALPDPWCASSSSVLNRSCSRAPSVPGPSTHQPPHPSFQRSS